MLDNAYQHVEPVKMYLNSIPDEYSGFRSVAAGNFSMGVSTFYSMRWNSDVFLGDLSVKFSHDLTGILHYDFFEGFFKCFI